MNTYQVHIFKSLRGALLVGLALVAVLFPQSSYGSHIVGGDWHYQCLGPDPNNPNKKLFKVGLTLYLDCENGDPAAIAAEADGIFIEVFNNDNFALPGPDFSGDTLRTIPADSILLEEPTDCFVISGAVCVTAYLYEDIVSLSPNTNGYTIAYQRCCRNVLIGNIADPLNTGITYFVEITPEAFLFDNSSPAFDPYDFPGFACVDQPIDQFLNVTDPDGDSLAFKLHVPFIGAMMGDNDPIPLPPPYETVDWPYTTPPPSNPITFDLDNVLGNQNFPPLTVDPITGEIIGVPEFEGHFLIGFTVEEYRNGQLINTILREVELTSVICETSDACFDIVPSCDNTLTVSFDNCSGILAETFDWFFLDENDMIIETTNDTNPIFQFPEPGDYSILLVTEPGELCEDSLIRQISIDTLNLDIDFDIGVFYCGEDNSVLYLTDISIGTDQLGEAFNEWNWTVTYGNETLTSTEQNPNFLVPNPVSGTIELVATTAFGCEQTLIKPFETVVDTPEVLIRDTLFICSGDTVNLNPDFAQIGNFPYQWSPPGMLSDPNAANPEAFPDATTLFTAEITGPDSICSFVKEVLVVVEEFPLGLDFEADLNCDGLTVQFTGTGASCYSWDFDGLGTVDDVDNPSFTFPGPGTYMVSVSTCSSSSCVSTITRDITVFAGTVVSQFDYTIGDCSNQQVLINFIDQSFSMLGPIVDWQWTFDDGTTVTTSDLQNPTYTVTDPTTLTVTLAVTTEDDCTATSMDMLTVTPISYPGIQSMVMVCEGDCVDLNPGGNTNYTYFWFPNIEISSTTAANPEVCPTEDRTYTAVIEGVVISGNQGDRICQTPGITTDVLLKPNPSLDFTFEPACDGLTVNFTNASTDANCYTWDFDGLGTSSEENPSFTFPAEGTYSVTLSTCDTALCQGSVTLDVDVSLPDLGMFTYEVSDCEDDFVEITFTGQTETSLDDVVAWEWTINGDGPFSGQVQTYTVTSSQTIPVQLVITTADGCEHTLTDDVTVELIIVDLPLTADTLKVCEGGCVELNPNANPDYTYEWTPDDGSLNDATAPSPIACPAATTLYTVNIGNIAISGEFDSSVCEVTRQVLVVVEQLPSDPIDFDFDVLCDGLTVNFDGMNAVCYDWHFGVTGATSTEEDPSFTYPGPGTYTVVMSTCDTAACTDLVQKMIILELPDPIDFTYEIGACDAGSVTIDFMGPGMTTLDDIVSWEWMIGTDVLNGQNVSYTVNGDVELPVKLTITTSEGCMDMATDTLTINTIDIESSTTLEYCEGGCVELCPDADPNYTYTWTPDDGTLDDASAPNPTACPSGNQTYTATIEGVVISGGQGDLLCSVTKEVNVVEVSDPTLDFTFEVACDGVTVQFTNTSQAADCYFWDFGVDGIASDTSILENPVYTFPDTGTYVVTLSTCDDAFCEGSTMQTVELLIGGPVADFTYDISECDTNGLTITFMDESISILDPIVDWQWLFFPSGTSSDEQNPEITVDTEGDIIVKLTIMTETGCMDMLFDTLSISLPDSILTDTTLVICTDSCVELNPNGNPNYDYNWMPDDGSLSDPTAANPVACPTEETTYTVTIDNVAITGNDGEKICSITREVTVLFGDVDISVQDTVVTCPTDSFLLCVTNNIPTDVLDYTWEVGQGGVILSDPMMECITASNTLDTAIFIVTATNQFGCEATDTIVVIEEEFNPVLQDTVYACSDVPTALNPNGNPNYTYLWLPDIYLDDNTSHNPMATATGPDTIIYQVDITDFEGLDTCSIKKEVVLIVRPPIELDITPDISLCTEEEVELTVVGNIDGLVYDWYKVPDTPIGEGSVITVLPEIGLNEYYVIATDTTFGLACIDTAFTSILVAPVDASITPAQTICIGESLPLAVTSNDPSQTLTCIWTPDETLSPGGDECTQIATPTETTTYTVVVTNQHGCVDSLETTVTVIDIELTVFAEADPTEITFGTDETSQLTTIELDGYTYDWEPGESLSDPTIFNPVAQPTETTTYTVTVQDPGGLCSGVDTVTVFVNYLCERPYLYLPNAFTPNGDGRNDVLFVRGEQIDELYFVIYNRWGQKIFETTDPDVGWDGTFKGNLLEPDTYGYYLRAVCIGGDDHEEKGNISLLR